MKTRNTLALLVGVLALALCFFREDDVAVKRAKANDIADAHGKRDARDGSALGGSSWPGSPFGSGQVAAAETPHRPAYIIARQKKMESLGYGSPPEYYEMDLKTLKRLAKQQDVFALLQLAEQYYNEERRLSSDPEFPKNEDPKQLAKQYLANAAGAGHSRAAAILARHYFDENDQVNAYAWRLVSEQIGDGSNPVWGPDTNQFAGLSDAQIKLARARFDGIWSAMIIARNQSMRIQHR
jgi:hypothetical protein